MYTAICKRTMIHNIYLWGRRGIGWSFRYQSSIATPCPPSCFTQISNFQVHKIYITFAQVMSIIFLIATAIWIDSTLNIVFLALFRCSYATAHISYWYVYPYHALLTRKIVCSVILLPGLWNFVVLHIWHINDASYCLPVYVLDVGQSLLHKTSLLFIPMDTKLYRGFHRASLILL